MVKKRFKKEFVSVRWSDMPRNEPLEVIIPKPLISTNMVIPKVGMFVVYKAYFTHTTEDRLFNLVLPYNDFKHAIDGLPPGVKDIDKPIKMKFIKKKGRFTLLEWHQL